jgi:hypothetical protein
MYWEVECRETAIPRRQKRGQGSARREAGVFMLGPWMRSMPQL